ncbi:hypothetical protein NE850_38560 [Paraburkholderia sp. USG1]|uniref:hypothetical protein n=1 Tax=Paraburkholderia sp. USG1 TaxID=2952268 RepID=UPI00285CB252|nr:hypothetical protein [Paraburkholderia sp. USG1]MDR8402227.1 hypothetical protein [Paraburkholderia sp. USG1]
MLEYPDNTMQPGTEEAPKSGVSPAFMARVHPRGVLLIQDKMKGGFGSCSAARTQLNLLGIASCIDVFGPFDYVLETTEYEKQKFIENLQHVKTTLAESTIRTVALFCQPFPPD